MHERSSLLLLGTRRQQVLAHITVADKLGLEALNEVVGDAILTERFQHDGASVLGVVGVFGDHLKRPLKCRTTKVDFELLKHLKSGKWRVFRIGEFTNKNVKVRIQN